jgi:RNA polymerase sigma factor (sigma-70 family)
LNKETNIKQLADHLFRENSGKMVAALIRLFGVNNLESILDVVQDTFESALTSWKYSSVPNNPPAWLMQVAKNKAINLNKRGKKMTLVSPSLFVKNYDTTAEDLLDFVFLPHEVEDSQLRLLLTCCHPDFPEKNQVIITLHILCGFGVREIASALFMKEEAVKKAITRAKAELKNKGELLQVPRLPKYEKRIETVHTILYLMFNEGYKTTRGKEMIDHDLCYESMRLAKLLLKDGVALEKQTHSLLALMFFNLARFPARLNESGEIITLEEQDRSKWDYVFIEEGYYHLNRAGEPDQINRFHIEALIASIHCAAESFEKTDWKTIIYLYDQLEKILDSPVIALNKVVAESYLNGPASSLEKIEELKKNSLLKENYLLYAAEGEILWRLQKNERAKQSFLMAFNYTNSLLDKRFLETKISKC